MKVPENKRTILVLLEELVVVNCTPFPRGHGLLAAWCFR